MSKKTLVFDTETTGKYTFTESPMAACQPYIVSLAGIVLAEDGVTELQTLYHVIKPNGYIIPDEVVEFHKITTELAHDVGIPIEAALESFAAMCRLSDYQLAFNSRFDTHIVRSAAIRTQSPCALDDAKVRCVMRTMSLHMQLPGQFEDYKWPKLEAAYEWMFGSPMPDGAHNSLWDTRYTGNIAFALKKMQLWDFETDVCAPVRIPPPTLLTSNTK